MKDIDLSSLPSDLLAGVVESLRLAHKSNAPYRFEDPAGNILVIPAEKLPELEAKARLELRTRTTGVRYAFVACVFILVVLAAVWLAQS